MRMSLWVIVTSVSLALLGCADTGPTKSTPNTARPNAPTPSSNTTTSSTDGRTTVSKPAIGGGETPATSATPGRTEPARPDNSAVNKRDQDPAAVLPTEQGNNQKDIDITAEIRRKILQNKEISINGQNVKTPTVGGKVTLRGPVASDAERKLIEQIAKDVAGADNVTSELEVAP